MQNECELVADDTNRIYCCAANVHAEPRFGPNETPMKKVWLSICITTSGWIILAGSDFAQQPKYAQNNNRDRIPTLNDGVTKADVDRIEKTVEWAQLYLDKTWTSVMRTHGHAYKLPSVINGSGA